MPLPPPRRESFHFSSTGTNPPDYSSLLTLANDFSPGKLTVTENENAVLKESYTIRSTSSYSYSETSMNQVQQANQSTTSNDTENFTNTHEQQRKVSSLRLTPVTVPDPPVHLNSSLDPQAKATGSPPAAPSAPTTSLSQTQTASLSVRLGTEKGQHPAPPNVTVELKVPDQAPNKGRGPAPSQVEQTKAAPAVPPRPSPAQLLVLTIYCNCTKRINDSTHIQATIIQNLWGFCLGD